MIKVGIIGMGQIGLAHLDAILRIPGLEITALAGQDLKALRELQKGYGIKHVFTDWQDLVLCDEVDAVHNCTPNHLHNEINLMCLEQGKIIFSEKPLGMETTETLKTVTMVKEQASIAGVNFCYRAYPMVQWARELIIEDYLGEIRAIHGHYLQDWLMYQDDFNWRVDAKVGGATRAVADIGSHWLDLARYLSSCEVTAVCAETGIMWPSRLNGETGEMVDVDTEDWAAVLLRFNQGVRGNVLVSQVNGGHKNDLQIEIVGTKRSLRWEQENPEYLWIGERGGTNQLRYKDLAALPELSQRFSNYPPGHPEGYSDCIKNTIANFYRCVAEKGGDYPSFLDGYRAMEVVEAIAKSSQIASWVQVGGDRS